MSDYNLILGDSSEELQKLIEQGVKVDLTVTSPPYDNLRSYEGKVIWDFEKFKDIANKLYEITTDGGVVIWVVGDQTKNGSESGTSFKQALYFKEVGFKLHDTMIYKKINYVPLNHKRFEQCWEYMFCFSKGKPKTFNPILVPCKNAGKVEKYGGDRRTLLDKNQAIKILIKYIIWLPSNIRYIQIYLNILQEQIKVDIQLLFLKNYHMTK